MTAGGRMDKLFSITKRVFENEAVIVFIDLLGTRAFYDAGLTEQQATLLGQFDITFSKHFREDKIEQNFDVSIFADSIVVSQRKGNSAMVERLVDFSLGYQADLLLKGVPSRATIVRDSFFSFKMSGSPKASILGSQYTTISLCGGRGIKLAHDSQEGLPLGVYVSERIVNDLTAEQQRRAVPVKDDRKWLFIKQKHDLLAFLLSLSEKTFRLLNNNPDASTTAIRRALKTSHPEKEALKKLMPWVLVHLGRQNEIHRRTSKCSRPRKLGG
jgi:hypothetical protein